MQTPLHRPYHQQACCTQPVNEVFCADASKEQVNMPGQSSGTGYRLAEDGYYLFVGKLLMGWSGQHE